MTLKDLKVGQCCTVEKVAAQGILKRRFFEMGITPGTEIYLRKVAPLGDPIQISLRGYELSIRKAEAENIIIKNIED
ncbi:MAG TPA: ferrous iron transport protein A [Clostridia bacterium]